MRPEAYCIQAVLLLLWLYMDKNLEKQIDEILTRGVTEVIDKENLKKRLLAGEKLRVKLD